MTSDRWTKDDIDLCALSTAVDLLDALIDGCALAQPGRDATDYARSFRLLGDSTAIAAADLEALIGLPQPARRAVA